MQTDQSQKYTVDPRTSTIALNQKILDSCVLPKIKVPHRLSVFFKKSLLGLDPKHCWEMDEIYENIQKAKSNLANYKKLHAQKWGTWLESLAQALADSAEDDSQDKNITTMKNRCEK
jgi:hypothetical protein